MEDIASVKKVQGEMEKIIQAAMSDEELWEIEYEKFEKTSSFLKFKQILDTIYKHQGFFKDEAFDEPYADAGALAMADIHNIVTYGETKNHIKLTKKGRFFARMYLDKHPLV